MNTREKMEAIAQWLGWQHENMSFGLRSVADAEKLYDYWQARTDTLPEFADDESDDEEIDVATYRVNALGYDPMAHN